MDSKNPYMNSTIAYLRLDSPKNVKSAPKKPFWTWTKIGLIISFVMLILLFFQYYDRLGLKSKVGDIEKDIEKFLKDEFEDFRKQHDKVYETIEEYEKRFKIFVENLKRVRASKKIFGMSPLLDRSIDEFKPLMMPTSYHKKIQKSISKLPLAMVEDFEEFYDIDDDDLDVPRSMDWRSRKLVTPVKNQLQCGSCWAFATAAIVETQNALSTGQLMSLSEQQMVDCFGWCNGTYVDDALGLYTLIVSQRDDTLIKNVILYEFDRVPYTNKTAKTVALEIQEVYGPEIISVRAVQTYWKKFRNDSFDLEDGRRSNTGIDTFTDEDLQDLLDENPWSTQDELAEKLVDRWKYVVDHDGDYFDE